MGVFMKSIYSMVALVIFGASGLLAQNGSSIAHPDTAHSVTLSLSGHELIESLRKGYESNSYDAFLANLNSDYQQMVQSGQIDEFVKMREAPPADKNLQQIADRWETIHQKLIAERNEELKEAVAGQTDQILFNRIQSIVSPIPDDQNEALQYMVALRFKTPANAANDDERKLIEIDLASEFKIVHLDAQYAQKPFDDRFEKNIVINMDAMHQMQEASKSFKDSDLQKKVELASKGFDTWQARHWDLNLLHQIIKKPTNDTERKIASIFGKYREKTNDLYQKEFLAKREPTKDRSE
jgi:hypothetical protein